MREFKRDTNEIKINQYCHTVKNIDKKVHPDSKLAVAIHENICNSVGQNIRNTRVFDISIRIIIRFWYSNTRVLKPNLTSLITN